MPRATTRTKLSLTRWAEIMGLDPRHFSQVVTAAKPSTICSAVWKQYPWQDADLISREDVALAIQDAERLIEDYVGYNLLPDWTVDERIFMTPAAIPEVINVSLLTARRFPTTVKVGRGHIISGGIQTKAVISAGEAVAYTDEDGDGYPETATITAATTVTDPDEIAVFVPGESAHDDAEFRPLANPITRRRDVTIAAGVVTIVMAREQLADPDLITALAPGQIDGNVDANFLATVDVYRRRNDPQTQATLMWSPREGMLCNCADTTCPTCAHSTQVGCLLAYDYRQGIFQVQPATFDSDDETFTATIAAVGRTPDKVRAWYYSGLQDQRRDSPTLEMEGQWERAVTYLSLTKMTRVVCNCSNVQAFSRRMTEDLAASVSNEAGGVSFNLPDSLASSPWGTMRGALMAWQLANSMSDRKIGQAVAL